MTVGYDDPEQGRIARPESADVRQGDVLVHRRGERPTKVEDQPLPVLLKLDAAAADLGCTADDAAAHYVQWAGRRVRVIAFDVIGAEGRLRSGDLTARCRRCSP